MSTTPTALDVKSWIAHLFFVVSALSVHAAGNTMDIPIDLLGTRYQIIGKLHAPLGQPVTVQGIVVEGPFKGYEGGPNIRPQRIDGRATQEDIQIVLSPYFNKFGEKANAGKPLPKLETGKTYEMEGFETGGYIGVSAEAYERAGLQLQTAEHYFRTVFNVYQAKQIEPVRFAPQDFQGRTALLQGTARSSGRQALMEGNGWIVIVDPNAPWPADINGKRIETYGMYNVGSDTKRYNLVDGTWRLVQLEDQLGRRVELRGCARSLNDVWWFDYRGTPLYVEHMADLPGWSANCHWRPMVIRGTLEKAMLPRLDQVSLKPDRDMKEYFIVRKPSWEPLDHLLGPERPLDEPE